MVRISLDIPDQTFIALKLSPDKFGDEIRLVAAIKLYEVGKLSSGAAAQMAGVPKPLFLSKLSDYGVNTFDLSEEELLGEATIG